MTAERPFERGERVLVKANGWPYTGMEGVVFSQEGDFVEVGMLACADTACYRADELKRVEEPPRATEGDAK